MKTMMLTGALILTAGVATGLAQEVHNYEYRRVESSGGGAGMVAFQGLPFVFERSEMAFDGAVVKGAPYSAEAVTETTQALADGNRIHRTTKSSLYRDSLGRTRREQTLGEVGSLVASGEPIRTIVISDPVAGSNYMLDTRQKVAHKMPNKGEMQVRAMAELDAAKLAKVKAEAEFSHIGIASTGTMSTVVRMNRRGSEEESKNIKKESLGTLMIEGVAADGTRTTLTIPAGAVGNDLPIDVVTERWYSTQLQTTVMTKTIDPRMGETIYKLTNIKLAEPDQSMFAVPADYSVQ